MQAVVQVLLLRNSSAAAGTFNSRTEAPSETQENYQRNAGPGGSVGSCRVVNRSAQLTGDRPSGSDGRQTAPVGLRRHRSLQGLSRRSVQGLLTHCARGTRKDRRLEKQGDRRSEEHTSELQS